MSRHKNKCRGDDSATDSPDDSDAADGRSGQSKRKWNHSAPILAKIKIKGYDATDALPNKLNFSHLDIAGIIVSICSFFLDIAFDVVVAIMHYRNGNEWWFTLTLCFVFVPSLTMTGFSLRWYLQDADEKCLPVVSTKRWVVRIVFLILQMGPLLRYFDSLYYGLKSNQSKGNVQEQVTYYKQMIYEDADATLLRLFECFMEAAPQLVLQLYIYILSQPESLNYYTWTEIIQMISMFSSLISMSWALASYNRALRYSLQDKKNMTNCGTCVQILWRFFDISSRVLALGVFASVFPTYLFAVCGAHYLVMFIWIRVMGTSFCNNYCAEYFYNIVLGIVYIFCYFNPKDSPTRRRITFYYVLVFLENSTMMVLWFNHSTTHNTYKYPALFLQFLSFILSIVIMIIYYLLLHPTKNISVWENWTKSKPTTIQMQPVDPDEKLNAQSNEVQEQRF